MNKEELLKEAKLRYPTGCEAKCIYSNSYGIRKITDNNDYSFTGKDDRWLWLKTNDIYIAVYNDSSKLWAEIVSYPENYISPTESILKNVVIW